jgi:two-component system, chemotaxis family, protein-glutamate methylesterase/glutaminase
MPDSRPGTLPIRILIADDSLVTREMLAQIVSSDPDIEVAGFAADGEEAVRLTAELKPDLVTMDIHMPKLDGLAATERIMAYTPTPILVVSSSVHGEGMGVAFDALDAGALEVLKKPEPRDWADLERIGRELIRKIKILSRVRVITHVRGRHPDAATPGQSGPVVSTPSRRGRFNLVAIGSSTGGPSALGIVLGALAPDFPLPVVIAQHIAEGFIPGLVEWLDRACSIPVRAAIDGDVAEPGHAYLAPTGLNLEVSGLHMRFAKPLGGQLYIPSADSLFASVAASHGKRSLGVILTGMGADGARGLKAMHDMGAFTIAQDEASSVVYGMPRAAAELGAAEVVLPVEEIGSALTKLGLEGTR